jgi:hypothetical protein
VLPAFPPAAVPPLPAVGSPPCPAVPAEPPLVALPPLPAEPPPWPAEPPDESSLEQPLIKTDAVPAPNISSKAICERFMIQPPKRPRLCHSREARATMNADKCICEYPCLSIETND